MPFRRKGKAGLTARLDVRVSPAEKEQLGGIAHEAGLRRRAGAAARARAAGRVPHGHHHHPGATAPRGPAQDGPRQERRRLPPADGRAAHDAARRGRQAGGRAVGRQGQ
jgi:hypothetical protein